MKLTRRGHYSVRALLDLVMCGAQGPVSVRDISRRQGLPAPYLEKLLIELRQAGIVQSVRGVQGGYQLSRRPREISLAAILAAVGEQVEPLPRLSPDAQQAGDWVTFALWQRLHHKLQEALDSISLEDLYYDARSWQASQGEDTGFVV